MNKLIARIVVGLLFIGISLGANAEMLKANVLKFQAVGTNLEITFLPDFSPTASNHHTTTMLFYGERASWYKANGTLYVVGVPDDLKMVDKKTGIITLFSPNTPVNISRQLAVSMAADLTIASIYYSNVHYLTVLSRTPSTINYYKTAPSNYIYRDEIGRAHV